MMFSSWGTRGGWYDEITKSRKITKLWDWGWKEHVTLKFDKLLGGRRLPNSTAIALTQTVLGGLETARSSDHYSDVIMSAMAPQITGASIVCSIICSGADQRKHQISAPLAFVRESTSGRWIPSKGQKRGKWFDDVIMYWNPPQPCRVRPAHQLP